MKYNVVFEYNNVENPYLIIKTYENDAQTNKITINLSQSTMVNGLPENVDEFIREINNSLQEKSITKDRALFVLNCSQQTKLTFKLPKLNDRKTRKLYENEVEEKIKDVNTYIRSSYSSENDKEKIYYEYLLDNKFAEFFKGLGTKLGFKENECCLFSDYLYDAIKNRTTEKTYCYLYDESDITSAIIIINGSLCSYASFLNTKPNFNLYVTTTLENHYQNLEKVKVDKILSNKKN